MSPIVREVHTLVNEAVDRADPFAIQRCICVVYNWNPHKRVATAIKYARKGDTEYRSLLMNWVYQGLTH